jgi:3D (Asp-Asp-Asp) domain-containing protein
MDRNWDIVSRHLGLRRLLVVVAALVAAVALGGQVLARSDDAANARIVRSEDQPEAAIAQQAEALTETAELASDTQTPEPQTQLAMRAVAGPETIAARPSARRHTRIIWLEVTAYCPCAKCCGRQTGITASGKSVRFDGGRFCAADTDLLPFGTRLSIPGYHNGRSVQVIDRGGMIKGHRLDVYFPSHQEALRWGRQRLPVTIVER